jgi:hypothetical protein
MANSYCCFQGRGTVSMVKLSDYLAGLAPLIEVGNCLKADIQIKEKVVETPNMQSKSTGAGCRTTSIESMTGVLQLACFKDSNLVNALFGTLTVSPAAALVPETHCAYKNGVINFGQIPATPANIVVKGFGTTIATTYVLGVDYTISQYGNGIVITANSSIPAPVVTAGVAAKNITITYSSIATSTIDIASQPPSNFYIEIAGANISADIKTEDAFLTRLFKCSISPTKVLELLGDNKNSILEIDFTMLPEPTLQARFNASTPYSTFIKPF